MCRHSDCGCVIRYILEYDGICPNARMAADLYRPDDPGSSADEDIIPQFWHHATFGTNGDLMLEKDTLPAFDGTVDDDSITMDENKAGSKGCITANDAPCQYGIQLVEEHGQWRDTEVLGALHTTVKNHCERSVSKESLQPVQIRVFPVDPLCLRGNVGLYQFEKVHELHDKCRMNRITSRNRCQAGSLHPLLLHIRPFFGAFFAYEMGVLGFFPDVFDISASDG
jgi:hypothetical protein